MRIGKRLYEGSARKSNALKDNVGRRMRAPLNVYEETLSHLNLSVITSWKLEGTKIESVLRFSNSPLSYSVCFGVFYGTIYILIDLLF